MKIVFLTNVLNHHQLPLSLEYANNETVDFVFLSSEEMPTERIKLKTPEFSNKYSWCKKINLSKEIELDGLKDFLDADIAVVGSVPKKYRYFVKRRLSSGMPVFFAQERVYKTKPNILEFPLRFLMYFFRHSIHKNKYILCASAFTSFDYSLTRNFKNRCYKWGYFTEFIELPPLFFDEKKNSLNKQREIIWAGRFLDWKHPEAIIFLAEHLKSLKFNFHITMIGDGEMFQTIKQQINSRHLGDCITLLGALSPDEIRKKMMSSDIFVMTSDRNEGWGAVLNEAMNSGCACVASNMIGSVPYLIKQNVNGIIFEDQNWTSLCEAVDKLILNNDFRLNISEKAFLTIKIEWSPSVAAANSLVLFNSILEKKECKIYSGPCSKAEFYSDKWFKHEN